MEVRICRKNGIGFRFDVYSWYFTTQRLNVDLDGIKDIDSENLFYSLLYGAHESYCRHSIFKRNRFTFEQFVNKIDSLPYKAIKELQLIIAESVKNENEAGKELKKKLPNGVN